MDIGCGFCCYDGFDGEVYSRLNVGLDCIGCIFAGGWPCGYSSSYHPKYVHLNLQVFSYLYCFAA